MASIPKHGGGGVASQGCLSLADWDWSKFLVDMKTREGSASSWVGRRGV